MPDSTGNEPRVQRVAACSAATRSSPPRSSIASPSTPIVITTKGKSYRMRKRRSEQGPVEATSVDEPAPAPAKKEVKEGKPKKSQQ